MNRVVMGAGSVQAHLLGVAPESRFGEGEYPASLDRLNWGAVFLGGLWALIHGAWPAALALIGLRIIATGFFLLMGRYMDGSFGLALALSVVSEILTWAVLGWFGFRANNLAWAAESKRIESGNWQPPGLSLGVQKYLDNQRIWAIGGALLTGAGYVVGYQRTLALSAARANAALWAHLVAVGALAILWLIDRRRSAGLTRSS